jgi:assimilatory nitrate reductase catalytic subunit
LTLPALVVKTIRPDTIFIPYHWPGDRSANRVTNRVLDPISKIPEFKVCAVRVSKVDATPTISLNGKGNVIPAQAGIQEEYQKASA